MTDQEILNAFTRILREVLLDDSIMLSTQTRREDVSNWDSFNYINFIVAVEIEFGVKFKVADIDRSRMLGRSLQRPENFAMGPVPMSRNIQNFDPCPSSEILRQEAS